MAFRKLLSMVVSLVTLSMIRLALWFNVLNIFCVHVFIYGNICRFMATHELCDTSHGFQHSFTAGTLAQESVHLFSILIPFLLSISQAGH